MTDLDAQRRRFAEEIRTSANLRTAALVDALAAVPREQFLRPGPWTIRGEGDVGRPARLAFHRLGVRLRFLDCGMSRRERVISAIASVLSAATAMIAVWK